MELELKGDDKEKVKKHWLGFVRFMNCIWFVKCIVGVYAAIAIYRTTHELTHSEIIAFLVTVFSIILFSIASRVGMQYMGRAKAEEMFEAKVISKKGTVDQEFLEKLKAKIQESLPDDVEIGDIQVEVREVKTEKEKKPKNPPPHKPTNEGDIYKISSKLIDEYNKD